MDGAAARPGRRTGAPPRGQVENWLIFRWFGTASVGTLTAFLLLSLILAFTLGLRLRSSPSARTRPSSLEQSQEGLVVSAVMMLVGLLIGFTFSLALERFEQRRMLVISEANAIGTSYLRSQLLDEPDRTRLSKLLIAYTDNRIDLAGAAPDKRGLLAQNDRLLTQIWAALAAALETPRGQALVTPLTLTFNELIDLDSERKVARTTSVPATVMIMLYIFLVVTAAVVGFVLTGKRQRIMALVMFVLLTLAIGIIVDLNRPTSGSIVESQQPMLMVKQMMAQPRAAFDQFKPPSRGGGQPL